MMYFKFEFSLGKGKKQAATKKEKKVLGWKIVHSQVETTFMIKRSFLFSSIILFRSQAGNPLLQALRGSARSARHRGSQG